MFIFWTSPLFLHSLASFWLTSFLTFLQPSLPPSSSSSSLSLSICLCVIRTQHMICLPCMCGVSFMMPLWLLTFSECGFMSHLCFWGQLPVVVYLRVSRWIAQLPCSLAPTWKCGRSCRPVSLSWLETGSMGIWRVSLQIQDLSNSSLFQRKMK